MEQQPADLVERIEYLLGEGLTQDRVAELLGISRSKLRRLTGRLQDVTYAPAAPKIEGVKAGDSVDDLDELIRRHTYDFEQRKRFEAARSAQTITFERGPICLVFGGDEHIGGRGTDLERLFREADLIAETPGMYSWRTGDLTDNFVIGRLKELRKGTRLSVPDEWKLGKRLIHKLAPKLVAWGGGNHDWWTYMLAGLDYLEAQLPSGILYHPHEIKASVMIGQTELRVRQRHQWKAMGHSQWNSTHAQEKAFRMDSNWADVHVGSHDHYAAQIRDALGPNGERKLVIKTGSAKFFDDYVTEMGFGANLPSTVACLIAYDDGSFFGTTELARAAEIMRFYWD